MKVIFSTAAYFALQLDECDGVMRVRWNEAWEVVARVQQIGIRAGQMIDPPDDTEAGRV